MPVQFPTIPQSSRPPQAIAKRDILNFAKNQVSISTLQAMELILSPCCNPFLLTGLQILVSPTKPIVILSNPICGNDSTEEYGTTMNISIADPILAGQTIQVTIVSTTNLVPESGSLVNIILDDAGYWEGVIQTPLQGCPQPSPYNATFVAYLISTTIGVVRTSDPITLSLPNCC